MKKEIITSIVVIAGIVLMCWFFLGAVEKEMKAQELQDTINEEESIDY